MRIDALLIEVSMAFFERLESEDKPSAQELVVYPELDLDIEVISTDNKRMRVTGKANWGVGYGKQSEFPAGAVLIAVEAKKKSNFGHARTQPLMYLAIIRQLRI